ncbi:MAG: TonB family protein, partial [Verrucomicrobia bacterium]
PKPTPAPSPQPEPQPAPPKPEPKPERPRWRPSKEIKVDLTKRTRRPSAAAPAQPRRNTRELARALEESMNRLGRTFRRGVSFSVPGAGGASYANYAAYVRMVYDRAWREPPASQVRAGATVKARIVIARDGTVVSAEIVRPSGDPALDRSVKEALDRVRNIGRPFPAGARDDRRTFILNFNLEARDTTG